MKLRFLNERSGLFSSSDMSPTPSPLRQGWRDTYAHLELWIRWTLEQDLVQRCSWEAQKHFRNFQIVPRVKKWRKRGKVYLLKPYPSPPTQSSPTPSVSFLTVKVRFQLPCGLWLKFKNDWRLGGWRLPIPTQSIQICRCPGDSRNCRGLLALSLQCGFAWLLSRCWS